MLDLLPCQLRTLMPASVAELLAALLVPVLIQLRHVAEQLVSEETLSATLQAVEASQAPAMMERMPLPCSPEVTEHQARSA